MQSSTNQPTRSSVTTKTVSICVLASHLEPSTARSRVPAGLSSACSSRGGSSSGLIRPKGWVLGSFGPYFGLPSVAHCLLISGAPWLVELASGQLEPAHYIKKKHQLDSLKKMQRAEPNESRAFCPVLTTTSAPPPPLLVHCTSEQQQHRCSPPALPCGRCRRQFITRAPHRFKM